MITNRGLSGASNRDVHNAEADIVLRGGFFVTLDEVGFARRLALKCSRRNRFCINAPTFSRICAQSGSSFGSNTTHAFHDKLSSIRARCV